MLGIAAAVASLLVAYAMSRLGYFDVDAAVRREFTSQSKDGPFAVVIEAQSRPFRIQLDDQTAIVAAAALVIILGYHRKSQTVVPTDSVPPMSIVAGSAQVLRA